MRAPGPQCPTVPLGGVECAMGVPLGGVEWCAREVVRPRGRWRGRWHRTAARRPWAAAHGGPFGDATGKHDG